jgi:2-hydroxychromene-2-carboxylate isomerase
VEGKLVMARRLEFLFDFGSPNAYLAWKALPPILERSGATLVIVPVLLGGIFKATGNSAPMVAFGPIKGKLEYEMLEMRRFIEKHGLTRFRMNPHFPVNTLAIMRGLVAAGDMGIGDAYVATVLRAIWEDGEKMDDADVIARVLGAADLDAAALIAAAQSPAVKDRLAANTAAAVERGVFGIPTFFVGDEMFFGKDRLGQVEEALTA